MGRTALVPHCQGCGASGKPPSRGGSVTRMQLLQQEVWGTLRYSLETGTVAGAERALEPRTDAEEGAAVAHRGGPRGIDRILYIIAYFSFLRGKKNQSEKMLLQSLGVSFRDM